MATIVIAACGSEGDVGILSPPTASVGLDAGSGPDSPPRRADASVADGSLPSDSSAAASGDADADAESPDAADTHAGPLACPAAPLPTGDPLPDASDDEQLALGSEHTCLRAGGRVFCWGENFAGQLGDGTRTSRARPVEVVGVTDADDLASGFGFDICGPRGSHTCARRTNGTVQCWGPNISGSADFPPTMTISPPTTIAGLSNVVALGIYGYAGCAVLQSGKARCWGDQASLVPGIGGLATIAAGNSGIYGVKKDGTVWRWTAFTQRGVTDITSPIQLPSLSAVIQIAIGWTHQCVLREGGTMACWGYNGAGQLGNGATLPFPSYESAPVEVDLAGVVEITTGDRHSCALLEDDTVRCWGSNLFGQVGVGSLGDDRPKPTPVVGLTDVVEIRAGSWHTCARRSDGSVWCWGRNRSGQVGDGTAVNRAEPVRVFPE